MRFFVQKRRQTPTVIIVALIDVLIVLLIFLMVTTTFKQQPALRLSLPESSQAKKTGADENAPLLVSIDSKGIVHLGADAVPVADDQLKKELLARVQKNPELKIAVSADKDAPFGQFLKVRDAAIEAKVKSIIVYTRETTKK